MAGGSQRQRFLDKAHGASATVPSQSAKSVPMHQSGLFAIRTAKGLAAKETATRLENKDYEEDESTLRAVQATAAELIEANMLEPWSQVAEMRTRWKYKHQQRPLFGL